MFMTRNLPKILVEFLANLLHSTIWDPPPTRWLHGRRRTKLRRQACCQKQRKPHVKLTEVLFYLSSLFYSCFCEESGMHNAREVRTFQEPPVATSTSTSTVFKICRRQWHVHLASWHVVRI